MKKSTTLAVMIVSLAIPAWAQTPPSKAELLGSISVAAPLPEPVEHRDSHAVHYRVFGQFTVFNNSQWDVKDLDISCEYLAPSGKVIGSPQTKPIYDIFPGGQQRLTKALELGSAPEQAVGTQCKPVDLTIVAYRAPPSPPEACPQCPDFSDRVVTSSRDLAEELVYAAGNEGYLIVRKPLRNPRPLTRRDRIMPLW